MEQRKTPTIIIVGAGLGGLTLYHALIKNKDKKEFNVKIFEREFSPTDRWQGYHMGMSNLGVQSLMNCIPSSVASNLPKATPNMVPDAESHGIIITDDVGNTLLAPPVKPFENVYEIAKIKDVAFVVAYRNKLRDILLEDVPVQWNKKFIRYEENQEGVWTFFEDGSREFCDILIGADGINSPVRKQKLPELKIIDSGVTLVIADVAVPKHLMDRINKIHRNYLFRRSLGKEGDSTIIVSRTITIDQEQNDFNESYYRTTLIYLYPTELYDNDEHKVDDKNPASVIEHVKYLTRKLRPECEMTDILLELWDLIPKSMPNYPVNFPFRTYNPVQRRMIRDIDPKTIDSWKSSRVTLLGDAAHAMSLVLGRGANNAIQDSDALSQALLKYTDNDISCIEEYEKEMIKRSSVEVLISRAATLRASKPIGFFGLIVRNIIFKIMNIMSNFSSFANFISHSI